MSTHRTKGLQVLWKLPRPTGAPDGAVRKTSPCPGGPWTLTTGHEAREQAEESTVREGRKESPRAAGAGARGRLPHSRAAREHSAAASPSYLPFLLGGTCLSSRPCVKLYTCPACSFGSSSGTPCCSPLGQGFPQSGVPKPSPGRSPLGAHASQSRPSSRGPASPEDRALCHPVTSPHLDWAPAPGGHQAVLADSTRAASG